MKLLSLLASALLSGCATLVPNVEPCSPTGDIAGVAALCQDTNDDAHRRMSLDAWFDFLYAQPERPDPAHPGETLPAKGPAVCLSSDDWRKNETAIAQLCIHGKCTYEQKLATVRELRYRGRVLRANARRLGRDADALVAQNDELVARVLSSPISQASR